MSAREAPESAPAVEVRDLTRSFGSRLAVNGISMTVDRGAIVGLLGPNGGGKTTLFRMLATLLRPSSGSAAVFGHDVVDAAARVRACLGVVFQSPAIDGKLTVVENLRHHGRLYGLAGRELARRCEEAMEAMQVAGRARDRAETLSGGLSRRVELAKVLVHAPPMLLLDEPSTGLDPSARRSLFALLEDRRAASGTTILLTTHFMEEAERCDRVGILHEGALAGFGAPGDLKRGLGGEVLVLKGAEGTDSADLAARIREQFGCTVQVVDTTVRLEARDGHRLIEQLIEAFQGEVASASWGQPTLEDVFVHLTGRRFDAGGDAS